MSSESGWSVVSCPRLVTRELGVPVLGSVSQIWTGQSRMRRHTEVLAFSFGGLMLLILYGGYMTYQLFQGGVV